MKLQLVSPNVKYQQTFLTGIREFQEEGLPWHVGTDLGEVERDFPAFVAEKLAQATRQTETFVPVTHLWAIEDERFVGRISVRSGLTEALRLEGGHIGYDTVPSARGRGYASEMLRQALDVARARGLGEVLLTCNDGNLASIRVIEKNGGVLRETTRLAEDRPLKRYYWIALDER